VARILLIEDDADLRGLLGHVLRASGYAVDTAADAARARERLDAAIYTLFIADRRLPDGNGIELADLAKAKGMATVVMTGYGADASAAELDRHEHLLKPLRPAEVLTAIRRYVGPSDRTAALE
jgi:DNA-binding response OmpR family regulator